MNKNVKILIFVVLAGAALLLGFAITLIPPQYYIISFVLALLVIALDIAAFSTRYYVYLALPFLHMKRRTVTISNDDPFYLAPSGNAIVVREDEAIYASSFVKIPIYKSATEMTEREKLNFARTFSRVVTISKYPVKIASQLHVINKDQIISKISTKLNEVQEHYNALTADKSSKRSAVDRVEGEVTMWHNLFDNVSRANSHSQVAFAMVSAFGGSEEEAVNLAVQRAEELAAGIGATLGITATVVHGPEMLIFVEPDYMIPPTTVSEMMRKVV